MLQVATFPLGDWETNCYVLHVEGSSHGWIIDAGFEPDDLMAYLDQHRLTPLAILLTHAHLDHMAGLTTLRHRYHRPPVYLHPAEADFLTDPVLNLSAHALPDAPLAAEPAERPLHHGDTLTLDGLDFQVLHTPGHSPGGVSLYQPESRCVFVGDALFAGSVGRTDFPTSDPEQLTRSIRDQLLTLPDDTVVLPGHGPRTTVGRERRTNPFLTPGLMR